MLKACEIISATIGSLFECEEMNGLIQVRTPFMYPDGDSIDLYLKTEGSTYTLSDLGETLRWLWMHQLSSKRTQRQERMIQNAIADAGVEHFKGMLQVRLSDLSAISEAVITLGQAAIRVADVWLTFRSRTAETITEEVADFLGTRNLPYEQGARILGRSGKPWRVDFHIRHPHRSSLVKILSTGSRAAAKQVTDSAVAQWYDLSFLGVGREPLKFVSLIDDSSDVWTSEDIRRVQDLSEVAYWSRPDEFAEQLAA